MTLTIQDLQLGPGVMRLSLENEFFAESSETWRITNSAMSSAANFVRLIGHQGCLHVGLLLELNIRRPFITEPPGLFYSDIENGVLPWKLNDGPVSACYFECKLDPSRS